MAIVEYTVSGDPARARQTAVDTLAARDFQLTWADDWTAVAEKGSTAKNFLFGGFAQYFKVGVAVRSLDDERSVIRVETMSTGWMGGAWGATKTRRNFEDVRDELRATFDGAGVLIEVRHV